MSELKCTCATTTKSFGRYSKCYPCQINELQADLALAREGLEVSANQLEGVSIAIKAHGQNINTQFFIYEYAEMAKDKREILAQLDKKEGE